MFSSYLARELTKQFNAIKVPHRIIVNKGNRFRTPDPPLNIYNTSVTIYLHSDNLPRNVKKPCLDGVRFYPPQQDRKESHLTQIQIDNHN